VAAKSKTTPQKAAKAAKPAARQAAKAKPAATPPVKKGAVKTLASALAKLVKPAAKAAPAKKAKVATPAAKSAGKAAAKVTARPKATAKPQATAKPKAAPAKAAVAKAPSAKPAAAKPAPAKQATPAPKPAAAAAGGGKAAPAPRATPVKSAPAASRSGKESPTSARTAMANTTTERAPPRPSDSGLKARAVKPSKPINPNEMPPLVMPTRVDLPEGYRPASGDGEYMNPAHLEYFRRKLTNWRAELVEESKQTIDNLREEVRDVGDEAERATRETENSLELRTRDRYRKLIAKIDKALKRIDDGAYGYCEETGEEIGIERLEARPIATLCLDAQERWEHRQKLMGD